MSNKKSKRATKDIPIFLDAKLFNDLENLIINTSWVYKSSNRKLLIIRDRALTSLLILAGLRIGEALQLKKKQFRVYSDHILLKNVKTEKNGKLRSEIILPKKGSLAPFTVMFEQWLNSITNEDGYIFPTCNRNGLDYNKRLTRTRAYRIISKTGRFPHWFRAVSENIYGRLVFGNNPYKLKDFMGLVNLESTAPYIQASWQEDKAKVFKI